MTALPSFDRARWRPEARRVAAAACVAAFAVALWPLGGSWRVLAALLVVETAVSALPWRLPRDERSAASFWTEAMAGLLAPVGAVLVVLAERPPWLTAAVDPAWLAAGALAGVALVVVDGMDVRALARGELAFLLGPTPRSHARARATCAVASPPGEEVLFRGVALAAPGAPLALLAAVAFVARHHVSPGPNGRAHTRALVVEITAAVAFLLLTVLSGSLLPALVAHVLNNAPSAALQLQRDTPERSRS